MNGDSKQEAAASRWAAPVINFKKLEDLPKNKPHTQADVLQAMTALHKMVAAQAKAYGGKHSKLLPVGVAEETPSFKTYLKLLAEGAAGNEGAEGIDLDKLAKAIVTGGKKIVDDYNSVNFFTMVFDETECVGFTFVMHAGSNVPIFTEVRKAAKALGLKPTWTTQKITDPVDHDYNFNFITSLSKKDGQQVKALVKKYANDVFSIS